MGQQVTESSLKDDIDVLLNMYSKGEIRNEDPEDKNVSPLYALGILKKEDGTFYKVQPDLRKLDNTLVLYEISCLFETEKSLSIERISAGEKSLGAIYHMTMVTVNEYLDNLEALGYIRVDRTAGLDMVYPIDIKKPIEIIKDYYNK